MRIDQLDNDSDVPLVRDGIRLNPGAKIYKSDVLGPCYVDKNSRIGPDCTVGRYFGLNEHGHLSRASVGNYCAFGARNAINPFNHPTNWLSIHEFQYHPSSFDWVDEYNRFARLERTPDMFRRVRIGNDVWTGHNVIVLGGVEIGDGAVIAAGSVVTKDVPPYAIVAGAPATIRKYRFEPEIVRELLALKWWDLPFESLSGLPFNDIERCIDAIKSLRAKLAVESGGA